MSSDSHKIRTAQVKKSEKKTIIALTMPMVKGQNLQDNMLSDSSPGETFAEKNKNEQNLLVYRMLDQVSMVHEKGFAHRDLKPHNFMIDALNIQLIDFGLSDDLKKTKIDGGSILFWPQEHKIGKPVYDQKKFDAYGLGLTLFALVLHLDMYKWIIECFGNYIDKYPTLGEEDKELKKSGFAPSDCKKTKDRGLLNLLFATMHAKNLLSQETETFWVFLHTKLSESLAKNNDLSNSTKDAILNLTAVNVKNRKTPTEARNEFFAANQPSIVAAVKNGVCQERCRLKL